MNCGSVLPAKPSLVYLQRGREGGREGGEGGEGGRERERDK